MRKSRLSEYEILHIILAILILSIVIGFEFLISKTLNMIPIAILFATIIISLNILAKKLTAHMLDADVEHKIWSTSMKPRKHNRMRNEFPAGIVFPLLFSFLSLGFFKLTSILTYETRALKHRAAKRFGHYSFTEMTDFHNALIGAAGIIVLLILSFVSYFLPFNNLELLSKVISYYVFFNLLPISNLDGTQIYFGSRVLYLVLASITLIFTVYSLLLV